MADYGSVWPPSKHRSMNALRSRNSVYAVQFRERAIGNGF